ncbi:hypothetical protein Hanom_Chr09g00790081 [Helianthus anomalus]
MGSNLHVITVSAPVFVPIRIFNTVFFVFTLGFIIVGPFASKSCVAFLFFTSYQYESCCLTASHTAFTGSFILYDVVYLSFY